MIIVVYFNHPRGSVKEVKLDNGEIWLLYGECFRCGECCKKTKMIIKEFQDKNGYCKHFSYESINGKKVGRCAIMWSRPAFCLLYPRDPYDKLHEGCAYKWELVNG